MVVVTAAIIEREGRILIARRAPGQVMAGKWEFPGGKIREGETPEECLKRELCEEFGILAHIGVLVASSKHDYDHISIELLAYRATYISGSFTPVDHDEIRWVRPAEILDHDLAEADIPIARGLMP